MASKRFKWNRAIDKFVRRIVLVLSATVLVLVLEGAAMTPPIFDHERLDVYRLAMDYVAFSYPIDAVSQI